MQTLKAAAAYFGWVFAAGFLFGAIRTLWIVPLAGVRSAELMESPIMFVVTILAALRILRKGPTHPLAVGVLALGFLLAAEIATAVGIRHLALREYIATRDPVSGTVYLVLLAAFAVMPRILSRKPLNTAATGPALLDAFIPNPDVRERHEIVVHAQAPLVFELARNLDIQSIRFVRAIFWLRAKLLGAKTAARPQQGLIEDMLSLGWAVLAEGETYIIMGAACQPWKADVVFSSIPSGEFASFAEPDHVKIAWTLEAEARSAAVTRFVTETRVVASDDAARAKFRSYWRKFGIGIVMIRPLLLGRVRREAESARIRK